MSDFLIGAGAGTIAAILIRLAHHAIHHAVTGFWAWVDDRVQSLIVAAEVGSLDTELEHLDL